MKRLAWLAFAACLLAGAAFAQVPLLGPPSAQAAAPAPPEPVFRSRPGPNDMARRYPVEAWNLQQEGRVVLCCLVQPDGRLACAPVAESPAGEGFGEAARLLASRYRMTPDSAAQWRASGARIMRLPMYFRAGRRAIPAPPIAVEPQCGANR